jgi:outer membrane protein assembly factor BamE (lipoprotein component of BamABCDE complex)
MRIFAVLIAVTILGGCATTTMQSDENLTVGTVQKEIRIGMAGGEVAEVLGSPNIVSTDESRNEVWIYDKISTQYVRANMQAGILALGGGSDIIGLPSLGGGQSSGASSQRTLTVVIKFDERNLVRDFAYHTSRF